MQGGGASGKENMGGRDVKKFLLGLYHYGIFIPKTYYDVCSMITCCGVWIYLHVRLCDMCLFLDEAIRGNYNATVSTASFASLCSSSCTMRGKQWCFFFSPLNSLSFFYQVSLHGYNEPHHSDTWVQQRESHCRQRKATEGELAGGVLSDDRQTGNFFLLSFHDCSLLLEAIARKTVEVNNSDDLLVRKLWFLS